MHWTILVPLKPLAAAKTRLRGASASHEALVVALAQATILSARSVGRVVLVTNEPWSGVERIPDPFGDLNLALANAASQVSGPVAVLPADVPALRPVELAQALGQAITRSFVPDFTGTGTVLLAAPRGPLDPRFGPGSAGAHERSGARRLKGAWPTLRHDVDTPADLREAVRLGWRPGWGYLEHMQGTVSAFDPETRSGELLLDDGTPVKFGTDAFDVSGLRLLRVGQRLRVEQGLDGSVEKIAIVTF